MTEDKHRDWIPYAVAVVVAIAAPVWASGFSVCGWADERGADHLPIERKLTVPS